MNEDEPIDWDTFDWNAEIWLKVGHTRAEIEQALGLAFTDDDWELYRGEVEYIIEEDILSNLNEACYWVGKNFDKVKQDWEDFKNWKPPTD